MAMNESKMSSGEVPEKFTEWLLSMGCPADKVPSQDKVAEMCRGQYYLVWRSLMEKVDARDQVTEKRQQVFCDDIRKCKEKNALVERNSSTVVPKQLSLWKQQTDLKRKVEEAKARVTLARRDFHEITDNISNKTGQRSIVRTKVEDISRRVLFLRQVAADLQNKKTNLQETRSIADSFCCSRDDGDIQTKLDKCLSTLRRQNAHTSLSSSNTSVNPDDLEEQVWQLSRARGDALCARLLEKRAALVPALTACPQPRDDSNRVTPQSVVAHTAALHCSLALETTKNRIHLRQAQRKLINTLTELNNSLSGPACELLVMQCERASLSSRLLTLRALLEEVGAGSGAFHCGRSVLTQHGSIAQLDKEIESKKEELKRVIASLEVTDRKMQNARECLHAIFDAFTTHARLPSAYRGVQLDLPPQPISSLRRFYDDRRAKQRRKVDLSMDLEVSDGSLIDYNNPKFVNELKIYLKKFNLEQNRQLILESGEKIWTFETIESSLRRLHTAWLSAGLSCSLLSPSTGVASCVDACADIVRKREHYEDILKNLQIRREIQCIDITSQKEEEDKMTDRIKKRLRANLLDVQKMNKTFRLVKEDLNFWSDNKCKKYISSARKHDGMTYKDYEMCYIENCINL